MIPEARQPAVARALGEAFGVTDVEEARLLTDGLSPALVFRIVVRGTPYLLRLSTPTGKQNDPAREIPAIQMAAEAGIAPRVRYASVADGVLILDFVERKPFPADLALRIAPIIRQIHGLPGFPGGVNYLDTLDGFVRRFQAADLLPGSETEELLRGYATIAGVYPRDGAGLVASHNDLNPRNILFDGARVWIVDWEAAFLNDRYVDLAVVANFFVGDEAEDAYLSGYFGEPVDDYRRSRFFLMRQAVHVFYVTLLLLSAAASGVPIGADLTAGDFKEFHRRILSGEVNLADGQAKVEYAKVHLIQALRNMRTSRFAEAVAQVDRFRPRV